MTRRVHLLKTLRAIRVGHPDVHSANLHERNAVRVARRWKI